MINYFIFTLLGIAITGFIYYAVYNYKQPTISINNIITMYIFFIIAIGLMIYLILK